MFTCHYVPYLRHVCIVKKVYGFLELIITSAREVMFSCELVCVFDCEQDNSKTYRQILMKFSGYVCKGKRKKWLNFVSDPDQYLGLLDP